MPDTNILVVDDDQAILSLMDDMLSSMGYSAQLTPDPHEGLDHFAHNVFDIVFSDVNLPGIDGIEMLERMRSTDPTVVPIIMTARSDQETAIRAIECGARSFLRKPFTSKELREKLETAQRERGHMINTHMLIGDLIQTRSDLEQRLVEQDKRLTRSERYLNNLLDAAPFAIISADADGRVLTCNNTGLRLYGYSHVEMLRRDLRDLFGQLPTQEHEMRNHVRKGGEQFPALIHQRDIVDERLLTIAHLYVIEDQTARIQLENQLLHAQRLSILGEMAPRIAHEFKVPLQVVSGYSELALKWLERGLPDQAKESVEHIIPTTRQMADMVYQIEHLGKPVDAREEILDFRDLCKETLTYLQPLGIIKYVNVVCDFPDELPLVDGDSPQIHQLLRNLIINAFHAMENVTQRNLTLELTSDNNHVELCVRDNGKGIKPDDLAQIFNPFFTTKPNGKGTGLGLAIVKTIVERHSGTIGVESEEGVGTAFRISFPIALRKKMRATKKNNDI
ncbi:MAG: PAS domain S-box-containing protein [Candidatus Latescibacterota bacterium]|jgi:PAS domain S-box-containing protein